VKVLEAAYQNANLEMQDEWPDWKCFNAENTNASVVTKGLLKHRIYPIFC
jgi:hypothetical protein